MKRLTASALAVLILVMAGLFSAVAQTRSSKTSALPRLRVSDNRRFLVREDGRPFFYLGDTAWELFHRLNREQAATYLKVRAQQKFTVIQAVALAELDGLGTPNAHGSLPLIDNDPTRPAVTPGADPKNAKQYAYWDHVEYILDEANRQGRPFTVTLGKISGDRVKAWWYNPRNGTSLEIGAFDNSGARDFAPPSQGFGSDWVLVLDDASKKFGPPGT